MTTVGTLSEALFVAALVVYGAALAVQLVRGEALGRRTAVVALAVHGASIVGRGVAGGHLPWSTMYEFSSVVAFVAVAVAVWVVPRPSTGLVLPATLVAVVATMVAALPLTTPAAPVPPALDSSWLAIHTTAAIAASGILTVAVATTAAWLWRDAAEARAADRDLRASVTVGIGRAVTPPPAASTERARTTDRLSTFGQRITAMGFLVWTFAVLTGAVWAEQAWGRYWGWDPKETAAFVTWLLYASALHAQATPRWRGRRAAWLGVAAYASLVVTYYVVNLVVVGLHSYA